MYLVVDISVCAPFLHFIAITSVSIDIAMRFPFPTQPGVIWYIDLIPKSIHVFLSSGTGNETATLVCAIQRYGETNQSLW